MNRYLVGICAYNEGQKIERVLRKFRSYDLYDVLVIDDGSTDGSLAEGAAPSTVTVLRHERTRGAGFGVRRILRYASQNGYEAVFFVSGNDKDDPNDIGKLRAAVEEGCDFVQGSRYLPGGSGAETMPLYRWLATRFYASLFSFLTRRTVTDATNGFRAVKLSLLNDRRIRLEQSWLDHYELEPYLYYKALALGYRVKEVPVRKIYPPGKAGYTKMRPVRDWWSILRPALLLRLGMKH